MQSHQRQASLLPQLFAVFMAIIGVPWLICWFPYYVTKIFFGGYGGNLSSVHAFGEANWMTLSHLAWGAIFLGLIGIGLLVLDADKGVGNDGYQVIGTISTILALIGIIIIGINLIWAKPDKDRARHYLAETIFELPSLEPGEIPNSAAKLVQGGDFRENEIISSHDTRARVVQGELSDQGWLPRRDSLRAAYVFMQRNLGSASATTLREETIAYIHQSSAVTETTEYAPGYFSAIRDGGGKQNNPEGVVTWDGSSPSPRICRFEKDYFLDRALLGERGNNLKNWVLEDHPSWFYNLSDVYGYCDGDVPYIVFPMLKYEHRGMQTVTVPACTLRVTGSPSGKPSMQEFCSVEPGQIPGPVYPVSLAETQRKQISWAVGRKWKEHEWGYDEPNVDENSENSGEFLLLDLESGRPVYVTPLTPGKSDSQQVWAYAQVPGDAVQAGKLNSLTVTVLADRVQQNSSIMSLQSSSSAIRNAINSIEPGFFTSGGGRLREFTPGKNGLWVAFAILDDGTPKYNVEIKVGPEGFIKVRETQGHRLVVERRFGNTAEEPDTDSGVDLSGVPTDKLLEELKRRIEQSPAASSKEE